MDFERVRTKGSKAKKKSKNGAEIKELEYPVSHVQIDILDLICHLICTDSAYVRRPDLLKIENFLDAINPKDYENDADKKSYIEFSRRGLEARLKFNLTNPKDIMLHINGGVMDEGLVDVSSYKGLSENRIAWINEVVSEALEYKYAVKYCEPFLDAFTELKTSVSGKKTIVARIKDLAVALNNDFRKVEAMNSEEEALTLEPGKFEDKICDTYDQVVNPARKLKTGMQAVNELLGGGFENGRVYIFFGLPGEGKSTTLLNLLYQLKIYNRDYKCKDPTKRPVIVLLTMENTVTETIERLFTLAAANDIEMADYSKEEVIRILREDGNLTLDDGNPINLYIKYLPSNSTDTSELYKIYDDLSDEGMEVCAFFQDYVGRIRSTNYNADARIEYGDVVDEFKVFATNKDIPFISAAQLNRDATKHIDEGRKSNKNDLVRMIGRSNISESLRMLNNVDGAFLLAPEWTQDGEKYLGIQRIKIRYRATVREYFYIPYVNNSIRLSEDLYGEATYRTTMRDENSLFGNTNSVPRQSVYHTNDIPEIEDLRNNRTFQINGTMYGNAIRHDPDGNDIRELENENNKESTAENINEEIAMAAYERDKIIAASWWRTYTHEMAVKYDEQVKGGWSPIIFFDPSSIPKKPGWNPIIFF